MSNLDTKALRALEAEAGRDGWASSAWGAFRDALERAAPALLDAAEERDRLGDERDALKAEVERLREALTPSGATKAAYIGEFKFDHVFDLHADSIEIVVPWTTIKDIMAAISKRSALCSAKGEVQS